MEKRSYSPNPEIKDPHTEASPRKKRRTPLEVLRGWIRFRDTGQMLPDRLEAGPLTPEQEEEEKKEKKFKKLFSKILPSLVRKEDAKANLPHLPGIEVSTTEHTNDKKSLPLVTEEVSSYGAVPSRAHESAIAEKQEGKQEEESLPIGNAGIREDEVVVPLQPRAEKIIPDDAKDRPAEQEAITPAIANTAYSYNVPSVPLEHTYQEQFVPTPLDTQKEVEHIVERSGAGPALLAWGAAEYSSRKRDKELKKGQETLRGKITQLQKGQSHMQGEQTEARLSTSKLVEQSRVVELKSQLAVSRVDTLPLSSAPSTAQLERAGSTSAPFSEKLARTDIKQSFSQEVAHKKPAAQPESVKDILQTQTRERLKKAEKLITQGHYENVQPVEVRKAVEMLAKQEEPIEQILERRHEVRGEENQSTKGVSGASAPVPHTLVPMDSQQFVYPSASQPGQPLSAVSSHEAKDMYRKAVISGFWTAIVIVAILILITVFG